jgi:hypothetical protein
MGGIFSLAERLTPEAGFLAATAGAGLALEAGLAETLVLVGLVAFGVLGLAAAFRGLPGLFDFINRDAQGACVNSTRRSLWPSDGRGANKFIRPRFN